MELLPSTTSAFPSPLTSPMATDVVSTLPGPRSIGVPSNGLASPLFMYTRLYWLLSLPVDQVLSAVAVDQHSDVVYSVPEMSMGVTP